MQQAFSLLSDSEENSEALAAGSNREASEALAAGSNRERARASRAATRVCTPRHPTGCSAPDESGGQSYCHTAGDAEPRLNAQAPEPMARRRAPAPVSMSLLHLAFSDSTAGPSWRRDDIGLSPSEVRQLSSARLAARTSVPAWPASPAPPRWIGKESDAFSASGLRVYTSHTASGK
jgi:hypothetical protein